MFHFCLRSPQLFRINKQSTHAAIVKVNSSRHFGRLTVVQQLTLHNVEPCASTYLQQLVVINIQS